MNRCPINCRTQSQQQGFALAISLILLVVITMLSLTAMRSATLDTKIAINHQHKQQAFQAAENALFTILCYKRQTLDGLRNLNVNTLDIGNYDTGLNVADNPGFIPYHADSHTSADLAMTNKGRSSLYQFSGHELNAPAIIHQADAVGMVTNTNSPAHNRMDVALIISDD